MIKTVKWTDEVIRKSANELESEVARVRNSAIKKCQTPDCNSIQVAIIASLSGTMAPNEISLVRAYVLGIERVNATGDFAKRFQLIPRLYDGASNTTAFRDAAIEIGKLGVKDDGLSMCHAVFGCWTSAARKAVQAVLNKFEIRPLFFYPVQFEGLESHRHTIYTGAIPNQQVFPVMRHFARQRSCHKFFLIGSDYTYPRATLAQMVPRLRHFEKDWRQMFVPYSSTGAHNQTTQAAIVDAVATISQYNPDVIFNFINGDANSMFFQELLRKVPNTVSVSFSMTLDDLSRDTIPANLTGDHLLAASYFPSLNGSADRFTETYSAKWNSIPTDAAWNAYSSVVVYARAIEQSNSILADPIAEYLQSRSTGESGFPVDIDDSRIVLHSTRVGEDDKTISVMAAGNVYVRRIVNAESEAHLMLASTPEENGGFPMEPLNTSPIPRPYPSRNDLSPDPDSEDFSVSPESEQRFRDGWRDFATLLFVIGDIIPELKDAFHINEVDHIRPLVIDHPRFTPDSLASHSWEESISRNADHRRRLETLRDGLSLRYHDVHEIFDVQEDDELKNTVRLMRLALTDLNYLDADLKEVLKYGKTQDSRLLIPKVKALASRHSNRIYLFDFLHHCAVHRRHTVEVIRNNKTFPVSGLSELRPIIHENAKWDPLDGLVTFPATAWSVNGIDKASKDDGARTIKHRLIYHGDERRPDKVEYQMIARGEKGDKPFNFAKVLEPAPQNSHSTRSLISQFRLLFGDLGRDSPGKHHHGTVHLVDDRFVEKLWSDEPFMWEDGELWIYRWTDGTLSEFAIAGRRVFRLNNRHS